MIKAVLNRLDQEINREHMKTEYKTQVTRLRAGLYGCRVFKGDQLLVEGRCRSRAEINAVFRQLIRTLNKLGYDDNFTDSVRRRYTEKYTPDVDFQYIWPHQNTQE